LVILDLSDPTERYGPAASLYTDEFYQSGLNTLREGGLLAMQSGEISQHCDHCSSVAATMKSVATWVDHYRLKIHSFGMEWLVTLASQKKYDINPKKLETFYKSIGEDSCGFKLDYYNPKTHVDAFIFSKRMQNIIDRPAAITSASILNRLTNAVSLINTSNTEKTLTIDEMLYEFKHARMVINNGYMIQDFARFFSHELPKKALNFCKKYGEVEKQWYAEKLNHFIEDMASLEFTNTNCIVTDSSGEIVAMFFLELQIFTNVVTLSVNQMN
jgi:hypothetical protein